MLSPRRKKPLVGTPAVVVVALLAAMACLVTVAVASAGAKRAEAPDPSASVANPLKYVTADSSADNAKGGTYKAVAQCPDFYQAISGGFDLHHSTSPWSIRASRPANPEEAGSETAWVVEAHKLTLDGRIAPFTAYAVCAPESLVPRGVDSLYHSTASSRLPAYTEVELLPPCLGTHMAIGGGFAFVGSDPYLIDLTRSQPNPGGRFDSWIIFLENNETSGDSFPPQDVLGYSVCIRRDLVKDLAFLEHTESGKNVINSNTPPCPGNTYPLSGGAGTSNDHAEDISWSHIRPGGGSEADPPKTWSAGAVDFRLIKVSNIPLSAHAMCGRFVEQPGVGSGKLSGKNRGWGDGVGGGRFK